MMAFATSAIGVDAVVVIVIVVLVVLDKAQDVEGATVGLQPRSCACGWSRQPLERDGNINYSAHLIHSGV